MASASVSTAASWTSIPDADLTVHRVHELLDPIEDDVWVAVACVDRVSDNVDIQRTLLHNGLTRTNRTVERCKTVLTSASSNNAIDLLLSYFHHSHSDAQLCCLRTLLLERLDRLNTYIEICKEAPEDTTVEDDEGLAEWEDDPWAEGAESGPMSRAPRPSVSRPPITLATFLTADLFFLACQLATEQWFGALRALFMRHFPTLHPHRFHILDRIPEHVHPLEYRELLPTLDQATGMEQVTPYKPWREELDVVELSRVRAALVACNAPMSTLSSSEPNALSNPLHADELTGWYKSWVDRIMNATGMVDRALALVQHGASQGIPDLDELGEELLLLSRLVYETPIPQDIEAADDWTLAKWRTMNPSSVISAYLAYSTPEELPRDISRLVIPYIFVLEARTERNGSSDPSLPKRLLYDYILSAPLDNVAAIFEASKPTLPAAQRLIRDDEDMARLALASLYGSNSLTEWSTMSRIFECLPAWNISEDADDDAADTTVLSLGTFVVPSPSRPDVTTSDLLVFFNPLPISSLSRLLDILDVHLESGEILWRWNVPAPLSWFLRSSSDINEQRAWANRMARRAGGIEDQPKTLDDWEWLLEDMLKLSGRGDTGLAGAFGLLPRDEIARIFLSGLLSTGNFTVAKSMLSPPRKKFDLEPATVEEICLACSREFYDNASSGNYNFGEMKLAYECLDVPISSENILKEKEFIEATSRISSFNVMSRPGIPISPIEIRLTKDRLSLVSRVLSSNGDAYKHTEVILDLCCKLGFRGDAVAEVRVLAMLADTALQSEDFERAFEASERMIAKVISFQESLPKDSEDPRLVDAKEVCWVACFQLGRQPEFDQLQKKLFLLGRALEFCPADKLHDILTAWRRLEKEDIEMRQERLTRRQNGQMASDRNAKHRKGDLTTNVAQSLRARLQEIHMPSPPLLSTPDAAALATKTFQTVAANFPFSVGSRGRSIRSDTESKGSRSSSHLRFDTEEVSAQASRVISKGIGWLIGTEGD